MPRYYDLPENDERRRLQKELRENVNKDLPGYGEYAGAMEELDKLMDRYSEMDRWGVPRQIDEAGKKKLADAITRAAVAGEALLANAQAPERKKDPAARSAAETVKKIQTMMSRDMNLLQQYDPSGEKKKSLPELQEDARTVTVDIGDKAFDKMSGAQSDRIPMTLKDAKGKLRKGFFTKMSKFSVKPEFEEALKGARLKNRKGNFYNGFLNKYREARIKQNPNVRNMSDEFLIAELVQKNGTAGSANLIHHLSKTFGVTQRQLLSAAGYDALEAFSKGLHKIAEKPASYLNLMMDMKEGERVDQRNSAMSAVADLLGKPGLIARSRNMRFRDSQGNIVEGTFMDEASGTDLQGGKTENAKYVGDEPFKGAGAEGLRQLCDLQVLDYLCGNIDRHSGNVLYEFDKDGKIVGIQGIDNDTSFSRFSPKDMDLNDLMTAPKNMRVISRSMKEMIEKTDPAMLKFTLRGRGLSEEEMEAAVKRLDNIKEAIKEGEEYYKSGKKPSKNHLLVLDDDKFGRLDISWMRSRNGKETSTINEVDTLMRIAQRKKKAVEAGKESYETQKSANLKEYSTTERELFKSAVGKKIGPTNQFVENVYLYINTDRTKSVKSVDDLTNSSHGSSPEFDAVVGTMKDLNRFNSAKFRGKQNEGAEELISTQDYELSREIMKNLDKAADDYLAKKMREKKVTDLKDLVGKNQYEKDRIEYVKRVKNYTKKHMLKDLTQDQKEILRRNDESSVMEFNRKMKDEALKLQEQQKKEQQEPKGPEGPVPM